MFLLIILFNLFSYEYDYIYRTARPLGMGGAFTAVSDDVNALFYNPAGLNRVKEGSLILFNPMFTTNANSIKLADDIHGVVKGDDILDKMMGNLGNTIHFDISFGTPHWVRKNFAIAAILPNIKSYTTLRREVSTEAVTDAVADTGAVVGYSKGFYNDRLAVGVAAKVIARAVGHYNPDAFSLYSNESVDFEDVAVFAVGYDFNIGAIYTFDKVMFFVPTVGISVNNILASDFPINIKGDSGRVDSPYKSLDRSFNLGSKFELDNFWLLNRWIVAVDINNIGVGGTFFKKLHIGSEAWLLDFFGVRTGLNQGYFAFSLSFDVPFVMIDLYTYAEELGHSAGARGDRRFGVQASFGF